jgi:hypothetical protein
LKPAAHLTVSTIVSTALYIVTKSATIAGVSFFCGFLLDLDHFLEYVREYGFRAKFRDFFRIFHETRFEKLLLVLHAWEWVVALFFLAWFSGWNDIVLGVLIGLLHHMVLDQLANGFTPWGYFLTYRAKHRFLMSSIVQQAVVNRKRNRVKV